MKSLSTWSVEFRIMGKKDRLRGTLKECLRVTVCMREYSQAPP